MRQFNYSCGFYPDFAEAMINPIEANRSDFDIFLGGYYFCKGIHFNPVEAEDSSISADTLFFDATYISTGGEGQGSTFSQNGCGERMGNPITGEGISLPYLDYLG